jgi:hypothetical protein
LALSHFKLVISVFIRGVADFNLPSNKRGWGCVIMNKLYYNDFLCSKLKLAIELDGYTHEKEPKFIISIDLAKAASK